MNEKEILNLLEFYKNNCIHIETNSEKFYNGFIIEFNSIKKYLLLKENVLGEMPILFEDIKLIEPYKTKEEEKKEKEMEEKEDGRFQY
jgi:hypothetical protein